MKKTLLTLSLSLFLVVLFAFAVSAASVTVADDGATDIELGACVIEDLGRDIPSATRGFTYVLDTDTMTAKITKWASYADTTIGKVFALPSTVTYEGNTYTVTSFNDIIGYTDNGAGKTNNGNYLLTHVYIPDTVVSIPASAFQSCAALEYVYIGSGLETWGANAFNFAGATAGGYYVDVEVENVNEETGEVTVTTVKKRIEETGANMGDIKEFILKSKKVTTMSSYVFHHTEFATDALIEVDITQFTVFESMCISLNMYALTDDHWFRGTGIRFDVFDIRQATSIANDAFFYAYGGKTMLLNADQTKYFNANSIRGNGANYLNEDTGNDAYFVIYGGKTPETAQTLTGPFWTTNLHYWYGSTVFMNFIIDGYVEAYDGIDGAENQNGYGIDQVNYFFTSVDAMNYFFASIENTTSAATTYARYAKNSKGYFNVCDEGCLTATGYNVKLDSETGKYYLEMHVDKNGVAVPVATNKTYYAVVGDNCTASTICLMCNKELVAGIKHTLDTVAVFENYMAQGKVLSTCINDGCEYSVVTQALDAIFVYYGYSCTEEAIGGGYSMSQFYGINKEAMGAYTAYTGKSFVYGLVASGVANPLEYKDGELNVATKAFVKEGETFAHDFFGIKINGMTEENLDKAIVFCAYVVDGDDVYYLDNDVTVSEIGGISYDNVLASLNGGCKEEE